MRVGGIASTVTPRFLATGSTIRFTVLSTSEKIEEVIAIEVSALGVARHYRELIDGYVLDNQDASLEKEIMELGLATRVTDSIMVDSEAAGRLAAVALELAETLR